MGSCLGAVLVATSAVAALADVASSLVDQLMMERNMTAPVACQRSAQHWMSRQDSDVVQRSAEFLMARQEDALKDIDVLRGISQGVRYLLQSNRDSSRNPIDFCCFTEYMESYCWGAPQPVCCLGRTESLGNQIWVRRQVRHDLGRWLTHSGQLRQSALRMPELSTVFQERRHDNVVCLFTIQRKPKPFALAGRRAFMLWSRGSAGIDIQSECSESVRHQGGEMAWRVYLMSKALGLLATLGLLSAVMPSSGKLQFLLAPYPPQEVDLGAPVFMEAKPAFHANSVLLPSHKTFMGHVDMDRHLLVLNLASQHPWENRRPLLFWRGGLRHFRRCPCHQNRWPGRMLHRYVLKTNHSERYPFLGDERKVPNKRTSCTCALFPPDSGLFDRELPSPRLALAELSLRHPDVIDAGLTYHSGSASELLGSLVKNEADYREHLQHRYLISVDGSNIDNQRIWFFLSGSLIFKQVTTLLGLGAGSWALQPWEHFVPVREDFADLLSKVDWARANDRQAQRIAERGQRDAFERLGTLEAGLGFIYGALAEYKKLFDHHSIA